MMKRCEDRERQREGATAARHVEAGKVARFRFRRRILDPQATPPEQSLATLIVADRRSCLWKYRRYGSGYVLHTLASA